MTRRPLFLHVGSSKTGTSALQLALWDSTAALAESGLGLPLVGRRANLEHLLRPLGWVPHSGLVGDIDHGTLERLVTRLRDTPGDRLMISNEDLVEASAEQISALMEVVEAADLDVRVIVTARDWAKQLPSEWQQLLKHRITTDYPTFLERVRDREGTLGETFWRRQDFAEACDRWGAGIDPAHVHLVPVPAATVDKEAVFRVFSQLAGFDPASLTIDPRNVNRSFGYVEAEMLRRLNVVLGDRLPDYEKHYMPAIRRVLLQRVVARGRDPRTKLPEEHLPWVREVTEQLLATVVERGYTVHGDHDLLMPSPASVGPVPTIDEAEMSAATLRTLADFAIAVFEDKPRRRRRKQTEPVASGLARSDSGPAATGVTGWGRRLIRRGRS